MSLTRCRKAVRLLGASSRSLRRNISLPLPWRSVVSWIFTPSQYLQDCSQLGGKNPVVVDPKVDVNMMAKRVLWGRFGNAGQASCALLITIWFLNCDSAGLHMSRVRSGPARLPRHASQGAQSNVSPASFRSNWVLTACSYESFYPDGAEKSDSFSRIVSERHAARIKDLLDRTKGDIVCGGQVDVSSRYVAPTIVNNVTAEDSLMSE